MRKAILAAGLVGLMAAMTPQAKGDLTWGVNTTDNKVTAQQTAENSYPSVTLDSYDVNWFDDYTTALFDIPENTTKYGTKEAMLADADNDFLLFLSPNGEIKNTTGWSLKPNNPELGDETIEYGPFGVTPWTTGLSALPTLTHAQSLVDINNDDIMDYILKIDGTTPITYGVGHTTQFGDRTQVGGSLSFEAIPEPASLALIGIAGLGLLYANRKLRKDI